MDPKKDMAFQERLRATFQAEADEHICAIYADLLRIEKGPGNKEPLESINRELHSLKGASRAVSLQNVEVVCQALEDILARVKGGSLELGLPAFNILHQAMDYIKSESEKEAGPEKADAAGNDLLMELIKKIESIRSSPGEPSPGERPIRVHPRGGSGVPGKAAETIKKETVRVSAKKLDAMLRHSEELILVMQRMEQHASGLNRVNTGLGLLVKTMNRPAVQKGRDIDDERLKDKLNELADLTAPVRKELLVQMEEYEKILGLTGLLFTSLIDDARELILLPFHTLLEPFPKMIRDLTSEKGKKVQLQMSGAEQEVDRRILEVIKDPLVHIIRNCIDHGIEQPAERLATGKPEEGTIRISISTPGANLLEISVEDDGKGISTQELGKEALKRGIISEEMLEEMSEEELTNLVFQSGFTTSRFLTEISGRGLGMTIVREKVEQAGGLVSLLSEAGSGTVVRITLPLTFGTIRGIHVMAGGQDYIVPTRYVESAMRVRQEQVKTIENREVLSSNGDTLTLVSMDELLGSGPLQASPDGKYSQVLIVKAGNKRICIKVDEIRKEQDILVKAFPEPLSRIPCFEGLTMLGSGRIALILNGQDAVRSVMHGRAATSRTTRDEKEKPPLSVVVAEDSMTARMLLKDILETAGYLVRTAVDGAEAYALLKEKKADLLVSDVEMPRLNGFQLTEKIRSDADLKELPVILVTILKSREDREKGLEAGANAYIEKGNFEPETLLNIIEKLT
jgi:two-component system chemotaxis sensor kinase CheA